MQKILAVRIWIEAIFFESQSLNGANLFLMVMSVVVMASSHVAAALFPELDALSYQIGTADDDWMLELAEPVGPAGLVTVCRLDGLEGFCPWATLDVYLNAAGTYLHVSLANCNGIPEGLEIPLARIEVRSASCGNPLAFELGIFDGNTTIVLIDD